MRKHRPKRYGDAILSPLTHDFVTTLAAAALVAAERVIAQMARLP